MQLIYRLQAISLPSPNLVAAITHEISHLCCVIGILAHSNNIVFQNSMFFSFLYYKTLYIRMLAWTLLSLLMYSLVSNISAAILVEELGYQRDPPSQLHGNFSCIHPTATEQIPERFYLEGKVLDIFPTTTAVVNW